MSMNQQNFPERTFRPWNIFPREAVCILPKGTLKIRFGKTLVNARLKIKPCSHKEIEYITQRHFSSLMPIFCNYAETEYFTPCSKC